MLQLAMGSPSVALQTWGRTFAAFLVRYRLYDGPPLHRSRTAKVSGPRHRIALAESLSTVRGLKDWLWLQTHYAIDEMTKDRRPVALKWMKDRHQFESEVLSRSINGLELDTDAVIKVYGWHTPIDEPFIDANGKCQELEYTEKTDEYPYGKWTTASYCACRVIVYSTWLERLVVVAVLVMEQVILI